MYIINCILMIFCLVGSTKLLANEYIEMSFHNMPGYSEKEYYRIIGKNDDHRFIKVKQYMPFYNFDDFYLKGVGLFEAKINNEKSKEYEFYKDMFYNLSKKDIDGRLRSTKLVMLYRNNNNEYSYKVNISSGIRKDEQVKKLYNWFENERKSMIFDKEMIFKAGVLMESNMNIRGGKVYFYLTIKNPTEQNVELMKFRNFSLNSESDFIQVKIADKKGFYIYINLDDKYLVDDTNESLKINAGKEIKLEFVYNIEDFYKILNNNDNIVNLNNFLSSRESLKMYMVIQGSFNYPASIAGDFKYHTLDNDIDLSPLKKFN